VSSQYAGYQLGDFAPWARQADIYVCGPEGFVDAVVADARTYGVPEGQIHDERFNW
jgi:ferredoxin-NADP reductase